MPLNKRKLVSIPLSLVQMVIFVIGIASIHAASQNQTSFTSQAAIVGAKAIVGRNQIMLPPGCQLYVYAMATGGMPSGLFAKGQSVFVKNANGAVAAELSVTNQRIDRFATKAKFHVIAGFGVSGFRYAQGYYKTNPGPSARSVGLQFVLTSPAMVAVVGTASSQQEIAFAGLPDLTIDVPSTRGEALSIGHIYLMPGKYRIQEKSVPFYNKQRPRFQADLIGVIAFSDQPSAIRSGGRLIPIPGFGEMVQGAQIQQGPMVRPAPSMTGQQQQMVRPAGTTNGQQSLPAAPVSEVDISIPKALKQDPNAVALILSIPKYQSKDIPEVKFAENDAKIMRQYLINAMGFKPENILPSNPNEQLTYGRIQTYIKAILPSYLKPDGSSDLFIYYTGHGAPSTTSHEAYLVPWDCDPNYVNDDNAYNMKKFYLDISKLNARQKVIVVDACFSGQTGEGQSLLKNASPLYLKINNPLVTESNTVIFQSSKVDQVSNWYDEKRHGMFTYFFLKGLQGAADYKHDGTITADELIKYINDQDSGLPYYSNRLYQRPQKAQLEGNGQTVIERIAK